MRKSMTVTFLAALLFALAPFAHAEVNKWDYDPVHSSVTFAVSHLVVSKVTGTFDKAEGIIMWNGKDAEGASVEMNFDVNSINTRNEKRDAHLRSAEFFDAAKYPKMTFKSTKVTKKDDTHYLVEGELTIKDKLKPVTLNLEARGPVNTGMGFHAAGFSGKLPIDRRDFDITWSKTLETGGLMVGHEVEIMLETEIHRPAGEVKK